MRIGGQQQRSVLGTDSGIPARFACPAGQSLLRTDGHQHFIIDQSLIEEFADVQAHQWDAYRPELDDRIWGLFGENDHLAHFEPLFLQHYTHTYHFPGAHTPTAEEVREYYVPLVESIILTFNKHAL